MNCGQHLNQVRSNRFQSLILITSVCLIGFSCEQKTTPEKIESWKAEIAAAEKSFSDMAASDGIAEAFLAFAAEDAVLMRSNRVIEGKDAIRTRFENNPSTAQGLSWKPDFVDVAASGELGYTYGTYVLTTRDSLGNLVENAGIFHTVWKRQEDGTWKFVWD